MVGNGFMGDVPSFHDMLFSFSTHERISSMDQWRRHCFLDHTVCFMDCHGQLSKAHASQLVGCSTSPEIWHHVVENACPTERAGNLMGGRRRFPVIGVAQARQDEHLFITATEPFVLVLLHAAHRGDTAYQASTLKCSQQDSLQSCSTERSPVNQRIQ